MEQTARYALLGELKYATHDGEMNEAQFIEMNAPTGRHSRYVAALRQAIVKAIVEEGRVSAALDSEEVRQGPPAPEKEPAEDEDEQVEIADGIEIVNILARSSVSLADTYKIARELFLQKGILKVDGDVQMTQMLIDKMTAQDFERLVGSYIANFTLPS